MQGRLSFRDHVTLSGRAIVICFAQRSARVRSAHALWLMTAILPTHKLVTAPSGCPSSKCCGYTVNCKQLSSDTSSTAPLSYCRRSLLHTVCSSMKDIAQAAVRSTNPRAHKKEKEKSTPLGVITRASVPRSTYTKYFNTTHLQGKECKPEKP